MERRTLGPSSIFYERRFTTRALRRLHEPQRRRIHAIAQPRRAWTVVEYVAQVRIAFLAGHRGPLYTKRAIAYFPHIFFGDRLPEAGPARSGLKLRRRT